MQHDASRGSDLPPPHAGTPPGTLPLPVEQRVLPRLRTDLPAVLRLPEGNSIPARVHDIAAGGIGLRLRMQDVAALLPAASRHDARDFLLRFHLGSGGGETVICVVCSLRHLRRERHDLVGAGFAFRDFHDDGATLLGEFLLRAGSPAPDGETASQVELPARPGSSVDRATAS